MKAFLAGFGIGVGLGILFAPDHGEATRGKMRERINDWSERFSRQAGNVKQAITSQTEHVFASSSGSEQAETEATASRKPHAAVASRHEDSINTLSREELMSVNGIGPVLADRIISGRPYSSRTDLVERGIIPQSTFEELERQFGSRHKRSA
ncbi:MAG: YtxH domain-containing protein [Acidobacteria bacterium]|nr:YtxH domain-containing protein [Acidobacteriota bacterium]